MKIPLLILLAMLLLRLTHTSPTTNTPFAILLIALLLPLTTYTRKPTP